MEQTGWATPVNLLTQSLDLIDRDADLITAILDWESTAHFQSLESPFHIMTAHQLTKDK